MEMTALRGVWRTAQGELTFELLSDGQGGRLTPPGGRPLEMSADDWRRFAQFIYGNLKRASRPGPRRAGAAWDAEEDAQLEREFRTRVDFNDMAEAHGRSRGAIVSRLETLGLIAPYKERMAQNGGSPQAPH